LALASGKSGLNGNSSCVGTGGAPVIPWRQSLQRVQGVGQGVRGVGRLRRRVRPFYHQAVLQPEPAPHDLCRNSDYNPRSQQGHRERCAVGPLKISELEHDAGKQHRPSKSVDQHVVVPRRTQYQDSPHRPQDKWKGIYYGPSQDEHQDEKPFLIVPGAFQVWEY